MAEKCTQVVFRRVASPRIVKRAAPPLGVRRLLSTGGLKVTQETMSAISTEQSKSAERMTTTPSLGSQMTTVRGTTPPPVGSKSKTAEETTPSLGNKSRKAKKKTNPQGTTSKGTTPLETTSKGTTSKGTTSKGNTPQETTPQETTSQETTPQETTSQVPSQRKKAKRTRPRVGSRRKLWALKGFEKRGEPFHIVRYSDVIPSPAEVTSFAGFEVLCSYSWQRGKIPTIRVPGRPRVWQHHKLPLQLPPDKGRFYIDQNRARMHDRPMELLLRAVECLDDGAEKHETTKLDDIDVISAGNSLRKLLVFVSGCQQSAAFRLDLSLIQDTLIIERCEMKYVDNRYGREDGGWGRSFETAFTAAAKDQLKDVGYFRALRYPLGDLKCVVLNEIDAFVGQTPSQNPSSPPPPPPKVTTIHTRRMIIEVAGDRSRIIPQSSLAELKSKVSNAILRPGLYVPQAWFARLPLLIVGRHEKGNFHAVRKMEMEPGFVGWEERHQTDLRKLVALLHELREVMRRTQSPNCSALFTQGSGSVWPDRDRKRSVISEDLMQRFWTRP